VQQELGAEEGQGQQGEREDEPQVRVRLAAKMEGGEDAWTGSAWQYNHTTICSQLTPTARHRPHPGRTYEDTMARLRGKAELTSSCDASLAYNRCKNQCSVPS
jgi:hypothetical protein